jgi:hypothetical protein
MGFSAELLISKAKSHAGNLVEKALAIDDALNSWEDKIESAAQDKIHTLIQGDDSGSGEDDAQATPEERLERERRRTRKLQTALDLERGKIRVLEASSEELEGALQTAKAAVGKVLTWHEPHPCTVLWVRPHMFVA